MLIFIKDNDYELWEIVPKGDFMSTVKGHKIVQKPRSKFTYEETKKVAKNYRALNILLHGLVLGQFQCKLKYRSVHLAL